MSLLTADLLTAAGAQQEAIDTYLAPLNAMFDEFDISTPQRTAICLAQLTWESERFTKVAEVGNLDGQGWGKGYGLIQLSGQWNQQACAKHFGISADQATIEAWLQTPEGACRSAGWYWGVLHNCNALCDANNFTGVTKVVNGGLNGLQGRLDAYQPIAVALGILSS